MMPGGPRTTVVGNNFPVPIVDKNHSGGSTTRRGIPELSSPHGRQELTVDQELTVVDKNFPVPVVDKNSQWWTKNSPW